MNQYFFSITHLPSSLEALKKVHTEICKHFSSLLVERLTWHNKSCAEYYFPTKLMKRAAGEPADVKTKPIKGVLPPRRKRMKITCVNREGCLST